MPRDWLSFTAESAFPRALTLVVGVAGRNPPSNLSPFVRPLRDRSLAGHFHAAAFSYTPLPRGAIDLKTTVGTLFETQTLQGVLHLLNDMSEISVSGQSRFIRGACWIGPIGGSCQLVRSCPETSAPSHARGRVLEPSG